GAKQDAVELIDERLRTGSVVFVPLVGEIDLPVILPFDMGRPSCLGKLDPHVLARLKTGDARETSCGAGHREEVEHLVDAAKIGLRFDPAGCEDRFDFGAKQEPFAALAPLCRKIQRADAELVACQDHAAPPAIPQRECELPLEMLEHSLLVIFPEMWDQLGITMRAEAMPLGFELD